MKAGTKGLVAASLGYALLTAVLYLGTPWIRPAASTGVFVALLSALALWTCRTARIRLRGRALAGLLAVALYASFASFGYRLFLKEEGITFTLGRVAVLIAGAAWFVPVLAMLLTGLERLCVLMAKRSEPSPCRERRAFLTVWGVALACQAVIILSFWPGGFAGDTLVQLRQAMGLLPLNDWHPVMHTLLHRFFLLFFDNPAWLVAVQGFFYTLIVARAAMTAYRFGARLGTVAAGAAVFCLLPNQALSNIGLLKDFPFTYALVWVTLLLAELVREPDSLRRPGFDVQLILSFVLVGGLRHNGLLPMGLAVLALLVWGLARHRALWKRAAACALAPVLLLAVFKGPVYRLLKVEPNEMPSYVTMLCAAGACISEGEALSEASVEKLETILPLEDWAAYYSRFAGHDLYREYDPEFVSRIRLSLSEVFALYWDALTSHPATVIKDRLDGMNLLWDVTQPDESFNTDFTDHAVISSDVGVIVEGTQDGDHYQNPSLLARFYRWTTRFAFPGEKPYDDLPGILLWRSGAWLIFLCVMMLYWLKRRLQGMWLCALPLLGNTLAMVLALCHQSFRYVYFVQPLTLCLLLLTVLFDAKRRRSAARA